MRLPWEYMCESMLQMARVPTETNPNTEWANRS